jgi:DNA-binding MarR family transcriptional regulator
MSTDKNVLIDLWLLSHLTNRMVSEILGNSVLSVDEFAMYGLISDLSPITSADLVRATGLPPTTVSSLVRRCEARGELVRTEHPEDARSSLLELTPAGYETLGEVIPDLLAAVDRIRAGVGGRYEAIRVALGELDRTIREQLGVGARPYDLNASDDAESSLVYEGPALDVAQAEEARRFVAWLRDRDQPLPLASR